MGRMVSVRLSDELADRVDSLALAERRTRSSAIVVLLERALKAEVAETVAEPSVAKPRARMVQVEQVVPNPYKPGFEPTVAFNPVVPAKPSPVCGHPDRLSTSLRCALEPGHSGVHVYRSVGS
jgi:predicted transcriptional regulator